MVNHAGQGREGGGGVTSEKSLESRFGGLDCGDRLWEGSEGSVHTGCSKKGRVFIG